MDRAKKGEVAIKIVIGLIKKEGLILRKDLPKKIRDSAKEFGVPEEDLFEFSREIGKQIIDEMTKTEDNSIGFKLAILRER